MSNKKDKSGPCPCGQPSFDKCCGRFITAGQVPATAELLMRSRYSAYALRDEAYLRATWFPETLPEEELTSETDVKWIGLEIKKHQHAAGSDAATVEFVARFKVGGKAHRLHEISNFVRQPDGEGQMRWYYVDGSFPEG
jgi:SEC-C motif-containing protein